MKKDAPFNWDRNCQIAFEEMKRYLLSPPVLTAPVQGKPLILYIATLEGSLGAMLGQVNEQGAETACYYLSRTMVQAEHNYSPMEKICLALSFAVLKLRHYLLAHTVKLISKADPVKHLLKQPVLTGRLGKWALQLAEFDIYYVPLKAVKGQAIADFLAAHPIAHDSSLNNISEEDADSLMTDIPC